MSIAFSGAIKLFKKLQPILTFIDFYLKNLKGVNNWDLVDISAPNILGEYLLDKDRSALYRLSGSRNLWERRIAIMSTFAFIKKNDFKDTICIAELLLKDTQDLIHKAVKQLKLLGALNDDGTVTKDGNKRPNSRFLYAVPGSYWKPKKAAPGS
jgi:hypothetical protein